MKISKETLLFLEHAKKYKGFELIDSQSYFYDMGILDLNSNWKTLDGAKSNEWILMFHATDFEYAKSILENGFGDGKKNFKESIPEYTYLGERNGLEAYLEPHEHPVIMFVIVRKRNIFPDGEDDWIKYIKNPINKKIIKNYGLDAKNPTSIGTLITMNQVKAENHNCNPLGIYNPKNEQFYVQVNK